MAAGVSGGVASPSPRSASATVEPGHSTVFVRHGGQRALVDRAIVPLVEETWRAGIRTHCSCQDAGVLGNAPWTKGRVQVGFPTVEDARQWLAIVAVHRRGVRTLYHRMTGSMVRRCASRWRWEVSAYDAAYDWDHDSAAGPARLDFRVFLYFPRADLLTVVRRLRKHNRAPVARRRPRDGSRTEERRRTP